MAAFQYSPPVSGNDPAKLPGILPRLQKAIMKQRLMAVAWYPNQGNKTTSARI